MPGEDEYRVWQAFTDHSEAFKVVFGQALLLHYQNILYPCNLPVLSDPAEIWQRIKLLALWIRAAEQGSCELILDYNAEWNKEYGLSVWFYNSSFEVGEGLATIDKRFRFNLKGDAFFSWRHSNFAVARAAAQACRHAPSNPDNVVE